MENHNNNPELRQWHETHKIAENGVVFFLKKYEPNSYEIKNELSWLLSSMLKCCSQFKVPNVVDSSIEQGFVKMDFIETAEGKPNADILNYLVSVAAELHSIIKSDRPVLRNSVSSAEYSDFLGSYTAKRVTTIKDAGFEVPAEIIEWISRQISNLRTSSYSIVHRDMRSRHLLFSKNDTPTLIDWEFSNISEPAQDVAKIIYDATVNGLSFEEVKTRVIGSYGYATNQSNDAVEDKVKVFLPIIPLERSMSLVNRRPKGYEQEVLSDLSFIRAVYDEYK